jgi:ornithine carbamoyltransferase
VLKDLLQTSDLTPEDLAALLDEADRLRRNPDSRAAMLRNRGVVLYFAKPSTRTRISFETAVARLGGMPIWVSPGELQLGRGETIEDTAAVLSRYADAVVIRTYADDEVERLARRATVPVINALTDGHHPCQSLADLLTIRDRFGSLLGVRVAYVGDFDNVAQSLMDACALAGVDITLATPPDFEPPAEKVAAAEMVAFGHGSRVVHTSDPQDAVAGAHVVYTDVWVSMGDPDDERAARVAALTPYRVDADLFRLAADDAVFMHCLPAHRGEEVTADVIDGPRSVVFDQAENRLHTAHALLALLLEHRLEGAPTASSRRSLADS